MYMILPIDLECLISVFGKQRLDPVRQQPCQIQATDTSTNCICKCQTELSTGNANVKRKCQTQTSNANVKRKRQTQTSNANVKRKRQTQSQTQTSNANVKRTLLEQTVYLEHQNWVKVVASYSTHGLVFLKHKLWCCIRWCSPNTTRWGT